MRKKAIKGKEDIKNILFKYKDIKKFNRDEIIGYYSILRDMLKSFNQLILDATIKGATLILAVVAATGYLPSKDNIVNAVASLFLIIIATILCHNLKGQVKFFADMLRETVRIAEKVEAILLSYRKENNSETIPYEILVTHKLRKHFPGNIHVKRRELVFSIFQYALYILIGIFVYQCLTVLPLSVFSFQQIIMILFIYSVFRIVI